MSTQNVHIEASILVLELMLTLLRRDAQEDGRGGGGRGLEHNKKLE